MMADSSMVRMVGLEPTNLLRDGGFKDRCVCQFHHTRSIEHQGDGAERLQRSWWPANS